ncbi:MAG TPA: hypothetical protein VGB64_05820 [Actinomycetota bacterium]
MRKLTLVVILMALALVAPMTGHALTEVAGCTVASADFGVIPGCGVSFICPPHTINLRAVPADFDFVGVVDIYFTDGVSVVTQTTEWLSGRIQVDGPEFTTVLPVAGASCYLGTDTSESTIVPPLSGGAARGTAEA